MEIENRETKEDLINNKNLKFDVGYFYNLDFENKTCFDCGGAFPSCVSINNGVFLCKFCGENHKKKLNYNISFIHDINDEWDEYLLSFATRGGNSRFKRLCLEYEVPCQSLTQNDDEKINKYIIRLGEYHRLVLKSEINCDEPPSILYNEVAKDPINKNVIYFPEFENYKLFKGNFYSNVDKNLNNNKNQTNNGENSSVGSKIWEGTKSTFNVMKTTTGIIYNTGKPIVSFLGNAAFSGLKYVGTSVWNYYMNNNNETNKEEGNTVNGNNSQYVCNYNDSEQIKEENNNMRINPSQNQNYNKNNNNLNYNRNNIYNSNRNIINNNFLTNSNKYNIFTINENGLQNNNNNKNMINKPVENNQSNSIKNNNNNIPYYYDINSINNESINNITFYLNNNNSIDSYSKINNDFKRKNSLLNHENIIVNNKYINNNNFFIYNDKKEQNDNKKNLNDNANKLNMNGSNNKYPSFNNTFQNDDNVNSIVNREIIDKNVPNIIGEEINQEKARYPIYQSQNLLDDNSFLPSEFERGKEKNNDNKIETPDY